MNSTSLPPRPVRPIIVPVEDPIIHQPPYYLCGVPNCPCHRDTELVEVVHQQFTDGLLTVDEAFAIYWNQEHEQSIRDQLAHEDEARREWFFNVPMDDSHE